MNKEYFYDTIAEEFDSIMNMYDTQRRIDTIFEEFWRGEDLSGAKMLDGGCGTGHFTQQAVARGGVVTALDIAPRLVELTVKKCPSAKGVVGSLLELPFENNSFDYVFSSEVIEHTPDPLAAVSELVRVLKPGGKICITVPNRTFWFFSVKIANLLKLRKYQGFENWVHYHILNAHLEKQGVKIIDYKGIHLFPFVFSWLNPLLYKADKAFSRKLGWMCVNIAAHGQKKDL